MKHRILIVIGAVASCLVLVIVALLQARSAAEAEGSLARLAPRQGELTRQLALNRERIAAAEKEQRNLQATLEAKQAAPKSNPPAPAKVQVLDPKMAAIAEAIGRTPWRDVVLEKN